MTLFKQIIFAIITFSIVVFVSVGFLNFKSLGNYIETQLGTNASHTANSLGLSIKPVIDPNDLSMVEVMVNSMFDSGYYQEISLKDIDGNILVENKQPLNVYGVPSWFINIVKLDAPIAESEVMAGWSKFGTLYVQSSTGLAYQELYTSLKNIIYTLLTIFGVAFVFTLFGLQALFSPLKSIQKQAEAILDNKFIIQNKLPFTVDLKQMVMAMNTMVGRVKDIFDRESQTLNKYQELLYKDGMTGLFNRRYFQTKISEFLGSEEYSSGSLIIISLKELTALKNTLGFESWRKLCIEISDSINAQTKALKHSTVLARLNDNDFAIIVPNVTSFSLENFVKNSLDDIKEIFAKNTTVEGDECLVHTALVDYSSESSLKTLLTTADVTLANARLGENFSYKIYQESKNTMILGREQYKELINKAMNEDRFKFAVQKVTDGDDKFIQHELFLRFVDESGKWQMVSYFMPMVNELNISVDLDIYILNRVANMLAKGELPDTPIAINLSKETLMADPARELKLEQALKQISMHARQKIYVEVPNKDDISSQAIMSLVSKLHKFYFGLGLDHFDFSAKSMAKLQDINPEYIKIQAGNIIDFLSGSEGEHTKKSLEVIAQSKGMKIVAIGVENEEQKQKLLGLGITIMQGIYIDDTKNIG
ncbi:MULTISPECIES: bifunctional diguanylate cyclase/phosphodiesterase [unclassified Campylobacter]|uniref:bifunctional diguanylate cyclase/phosphodiesterase n=1 Tax=unclassified Campylobacter TaxID=2593542 RepID=UPI003D32A0DB